MNYAISQLCYQSPRQYLPRRTPRHPCQVFGCKDDVWRGRPRLVITSHIIRKSEVAVSLVGLACLASLWCQKSLLTTSSPTECGDVRGVLGLNGPGTSKQNTQPSPLISLFLLPHSSLPSSIQKQTTSNQLHKLPPNFRTHQHGRSQVSFPNYFTPYHQLRC